MNRFPGLAAVLGLVLAAAGLFSACNLFAAPCIQPFPTASLQAVVRIPVPVGAEPTMLGQCGAWVEYDDRQYTATSPSPWAAWTIPDTDLERIGKATGRTANVAVAGADVFAIAGVDPADTIAMRGTRADTIVVLTRDGGDGLPAEVCRYLEDGATVTGCTPVSESP